MCSLFKVILIVFCIFSFSRLVQSESSLDKIRNGEWFEVSNSRLIDVAPPKNPRVYLGEFRDIMRAWNGGAYDTKRERLILWGGGHVNYGGNEVYVFDINKLKWERLTTSSPTTLYGGDLNKEAGQTDLRRNPDNTPVSKHSYDGLEYIPEPIDRLIQYGGSRWYKGGEDGLVWMFDFNTLKWERKKDAPVSTLTPMSAYDHVSGKWYVHNSSRLLEYNPLGDSWRIVGNSNGWVSEGAAEIDPVRRRFILIADGGIWYYDLREKIPLIRKELKTTGDIEILKSHAPGVAYSSKADKLVAWSGTTTATEESGIGDNVYVLDLNTLIWKKYQPFNNIAPPKAIIKFPFKSYGTYGRWRYIPSKDLFIGVNNVYTNVFFYRLPE